MAAQLGDDRLGRFPYPDPESLAASIGAVDGDRVKRLIIYAVDQGIIEHDIEKDMLGLSPEGWMVIEPPLKTEILTQQSAPVIITNDIKKAHCNICGGERSAFKRASHNVTGGDGDMSWSETYEILECCGCNTLSVQRTVWLSEWDSVDTDPLTGQLRLISGAEVTHWPPITKRKKPEWAEKLDDEVLRSVFEEVYQALNSGLIILASIGTRTLLDRAMLLRVGDSNGVFAGKLTLMVNKGHIGNDEKGILEVITDAGSASAHRGFSPSPSNLIMIIETAENFLHREFVLKTAAGDVRKATPSRSKHHA